MRFPFLPRSAIEPDFAVAIPRLVFRALASLQHGAQTNAVRAVWVGQVAGAVNLVRLNALQQFDRDLNVGLAERLLFHAARLVKWHVQKMQVLRRHVAATAGSPSFAAADQA